jgi:cytochrome o ubiquinol oxidase operon protein cyoD
VTDLGEQQTLEAHPTSEPQGRPPGVERGGHGSVLTYLVGLGFAIVFTLASFWAAGTHLVWGPAVPVLLAALAVGQMGIHVVFFFNIGSGPDSTNNFLALAFGVFVVGLVVFGSLLIMTNLNVEMPMDQLMKMQR